MLYISSIKGWALERGCVSGQSVRHVGFVEYLESHATVKSLDGTIEKPYSYMDDVIGVGRDIDGDALAIIHTKKTAMLHQYIDFVIAESNETKHPMEGYSFSENTVNVTEYGDSVEVEFYDHRVVTFGINGSIVRWENSIFSDDKCYSALCTMYDFLIYMCRYLKRNLLQYRVIEFRNVYSSWSVEIRFLPTEEAKRFLTKMWIDCVSGYELKSPTFNSI